MIKTAQRIKTGHRVQEMQTNVGMYPLVTDPECPHWMAPIDECGLKRPDAVTPPKCGTTALDVAGL